MKQYNCPDCTLQCDSCIGCPRVRDLPSNNVETLPNEVSLLDYINAPDCCKNCPNHPSNGGSGICHCTLPYLQTPIKYEITCTTLTSSNNYDTI